jgi:hypothetical protein
MPLSRPAWTIARRILSLPILGLGALFLMTLSVVWLSGFQSLGAGLFIIAIFGGLTAAFLGAGFGLWGRKYLEIVAGLVSIAVGCQVALMAAGMAHSLLISARADGSFDTHNITRRFFLFASAS